MTALNDFTPLQGGVPIVVDGKIVGAVGVSGAASAQQDEELAMAARMPQCFGMARAPTCVTYFDKDTVSDAFAKGAVLFDGDGRNYMVHASRREKPGMAEIHTQRCRHHLRARRHRHVRDRRHRGRRARPPSRTSFAGSAITGGETRALGKGDVIIVPARRAALVPRSAEPVPLLRRQGPLEGCDEANFLRNIDLLLMFGVGQPARRRRTPHDDADRPS